MNALGECLPLFGKNSHMDTGIAHHLKQAHDVPVVMLITTVAKGEKWRKEITACLANKNPEIQWWHGFDVGLSSAAIFSCFSNNYTDVCLAYSRGATPQDSDDLGRCLRLLDLFPKWKEQLPRIAEFWAQTAWPAIIARWQELEAATPSQQTAILREIQDNTYAKLK
jgi:hypothetical protein